MTTVAPFRREPDDEIGVRAELPAPEQPPPATPAVVTEKRRGLFRRRTAAEQAAELAAQRDAAADVLEVQDDPALTAAMSPREIKRRQRDARAVRAAKAEQERRSALAAMRRTARDQATNDELAEIASADKVDAARAGAQCRRLTEPGARLAGLYRAQRWLGRLLLALVSGGIGWMAVNVHNAAVDASTPLTDPYWWLSYLVDPLITTPLVVLLILRGIAARYGARPFGGARIAVLEIVLLVLSAGLNLSGVFGHQLTPGLLMSHVTPPVMVALIVFMYAPIMSFLGGLLAEAYEQAQAATRPAHLTEAETEEAERIGQALVGIRSGALPLGDDGLPSTNQVEKYLRAVNGKVAKANAQRVAEAIRAMFTNGLTA